MIGFALRLLFRPSSLLPKLVPADVRRAAVRQFWSVGLKYGLRLLAVPFVAPVIAATARPQSWHPFSEPTEATHSKAYIVLGSSGRWEYWLSPYFRDWNCLEDGALGEPSGKHSARWRGRERSFLAMLAWVFRNPYNWGKRTSPLFNCPVNECAIQHWGNTVVTDKDPVIPGWYLVRATHRVTGRVFYGYRSVRLNDDGTVRQVNLGYKLKPTHAAQLQDLDDADKAFTLRYQRASQPD